MRFRTFLIGLGSALVLASCGGGAGSDPNKEQLYRALDRCEASGGESFRQDACKRQVMTRFGRAAEE